MKKSTLDHPFFIVISAIGWLVGLPLIMALGLAVGANIVYAQEAPLTASIPKASETTKVIARVDLSRFPVYAVVTINIMDSAGQVSRYYNVDIPRVAGDDPAHPTASVVNFLNGIMTSQAGETGTVPRRFDFRVLTYLKAQGYLPDTNPVVP